MPTVSENVRLSGRPEVIVARLERRDGPNSDIPQTLALGSAFAPFLYRPGTTARYMLALNFTAVSGVSRLAGADVAREPVTRGSGLTEEPLSTAIR